MMLICLYLLVCVLALAISFLSSKYTFIIIGEQGTSWQVSYWFIIGTSPPVRVFMCIHVNTHVLPVVTSLTQVELGQNWYGFTGTCHHNS